MTNIKYIVPFQRRKTALIYPKCGTHPTKMNKIVKTVGFVRPAWHENNMRDIGLQKFKIVIKKKKETIKNDTEKFETYFLLHMKKFNLTWKINILTWMADKRK